MRISSEPVRRLLLPFAVSWALHGGVGLAIWGLLVGGAESPSLALLELVGPVEPGPGAPRSAPSAPAVARRDDRPAAPAAVAPSPLPARATPEAEEPGNARPAAAPPASDGAPGGSARIPRPDAGDGSAATVGLPLIVPRGGYQVIPRYPESARHAGAQGTVLLKVRIRADGSVAEVLVERSAGYADLDAAAVEALRNWRFEPARRGGEAVPVWVLVPVRFTLG